MLAIELSRLKAVREARGMSLLELAQLSNLGTNHLSWMEGHPGPCRVDHGTAERVAAALGVPLAELGPIEFWS